MGIYRITSEKDNTITNRTLNSGDASEANLGSNSELSVFAVKPASSLYSFDGLSRILIKFPLTELSGKIFQDRIIPSGSSKYYLKMFNFLHDEELPTSFDIEVCAVSSSWDEGRGKDNDKFLDKGYSNWFSGSSTAKWNITGSDYLTPLSASQHFDLGNEDLEVDITGLINAWLTGGLEANGLLVKMSNDCENNANTYYKKSFHGRETKYVDRLPLIEARWSNFSSDNRNNFYYNESNNLYLYNFVKGQYKNLSTPIYVRVQDSLIGASASYVNVFTASNASTGIYSIPIELQLTGNLNFSSTFYDIWYSSGNVYKTGTFYPVEASGSSQDFNENYVLSLENFKNLYSTNEVARLRTNIRKNNQTSHLYALSTASLESQNLYLENVYYSVLNDNTGEVIIPFMTGTNAQYTKLSYDAQGNYFDLFFNSFVPGFVYEIIFNIQNTPYDIKVIKDKFKFRVY